jgi:hypothetical protein
MNRPAHPGRPAMRVRGLRLPALMIELMASGRWQHPGIQVLGAILPWFADPLHFLSSPGEMERESQSLDMFADNERSSRIFHVTRGSVAGPIGLPWLDSELALVIAVNRRAGDDVAVALDYRGETDRPTVVASDVWTDPNGGYLWRPVAPNFEAFASKLGLAP